jgi:dUTP pyrophosphatase
MNQNMSEMKVKIVRVDKSMPLPEYKTEGAVAFDLYSRINETIAPGEHKLIPTNLIIEVPVGHVLLISSRSGLYKNGLRMNMGIIDQDYHGPKDELLMQLQNFTGQTVEVKAGDRLGQGLIVPMTRANWEEVDSIKEESRGGFGSTGKQ